MLLLTFAAVLLAAVLVSALAKRTILSTAVLFLVAGFVLGPDTTGVLDVRRRLADRRRRWPSWRCSRCCSPTACGSAGRTCGRRGGCPAGRWAGACR